MECSSRLASRYSNTFYRLVSRLPHLRFSIGSTLAGSLAALQPLAGSTRLIALTDGAEIGEPPLCCVVERLFLSIGCLRSASDYTS